MKEAKYMWVDKDVEDYYKKQAKKMSLALGIKVSPLAVNKVVHEKVIIENGIDLSDIFKLNGKRINKKKIRIVFK